MLVLTHIRIAEKIAEALGIDDKRSVRLLMQGSKYPDDWGNFPHHRGKEGEIVTRILRARKLFLKNDDECFSELGIALHYIADKWTLAPRTGDKHTKYENALDKCPILTDSEFKEELDTVAMPTKSVKAYIEFLENLKSNELAEIETDVNIEKLNNNDFGFGRPAINLFRLACCRRPTSYSSALIDLNFAYRICFEASKRVLKPITDERQKLLRELQALEDNVATFPDSYLRDEWALRKFEDYPHAYTDSHARLHAYTSRRLIGKDAIVIHRVRESNVDMGKYDWNDFREGASIDGDVVTVDEQVPEKVLVKEKKG